MVEYLNFNKSQDLFYGSRSGIRTHNPVRAIDFKSIMYRQFHHTAKDVNEVVLGWLQVDRLSSFAPMCYPVKTI